MAKKTDPKIVEKAIRIMRLHVPVTQECISGSTPGKPSDCMLQVAIERLLRDMPDQDEKHHYCKVENGHAWFSLDGRRYRAPLPPKVIRAYLAFDDVKNRGPATVKPFETTLEFQDVGPVSKKTREEKDRVNELRRAKTAPSHRRKYTLRERIAGTIEPVGRPVGSTKKKAA